MSDMKLRQTKSGVYVIARDTKTLKSKQVTVEGVTPSQFIEWLKSRLQESSPSNEPTSGEAA
ncbi:MAG: hypothetical protein AAF333_13235 [Planctomycetota bacterium]